MIQRLQNIATQLITADGIQALYENILDTAMTILQSDFASIQTFSPERGTNGGLRLQGHRGFSDQAAKRWEWVHASTRTTCGEALRTGRRVAVADVRRCDFMAESDDLEGYLAGGILAVQTTPLVSRAGALVGMVSTHWREPHELSVSELQALDILARQAADLIERSRAEEQLRKSEEFLRSAQRLAHVGSWEWDFKTNQISWSEEEFNIFGQPQDYKPSYEGFFQLVPPPEREQLARELRGALEEKRGFSGEVQIIRPNGELRTIGFTSELRFDEEGLPVGMFGSSQDITDVKKNEAKLLQGQKDLRALTARLVDFQESGMKTLARELHDDLSQHLAALGMEVSTLLLPSVRSPEELPERVRALTARINRLAEEVHAISRGLHPAILDELGLAAALREECVVFSAQLGIPAQFKFTSVPTTLSEGVALCVYRVAQEVLRNIAKHANATGVRVVLFGSPRGLTLRIEDTGDGFDLDGVQGKGSGLGLISMEERVRLVGGKLTIQSHPGEGTTVEVFVPLRGKRK